MAKVIEVNDKTIAGMAVHELVREGGRVERHVVVPDEHAELLMDLCYNNMESLLNAAQIKSFLGAVKMKHHLTGEDFSYSTAFYELVGESETKYNGKDVPIALLPDDAILHKVERNAFLDAAVIPDDIKQDCYGAPRLWLNMRSGIFPSMASELVSTTEIREPKVSIDNQLLGAAWEFQQRQKDIAADLSDNRKELNDALSPYVWKLTEDHLSNISVYWHAEDTASSTDSRVSMAKSSKFLDNEAERWLEDQNIIDPDAVKRPTPKSRVLKRDHPELYKLGQTTRTTMKVREI